MRSLISKYAAACFVLLILMLPVSSVCSTDLKGTILSIRFSDAHRSLFNIRTAAEIHFLMRGELLTSPSQLLIKLDDYYYADPRRGERIGPRFYGDTLYRKDGRYEALERIVIEKDGRLKMYLNKDFGEAAYFGYRPKFVFKRDTTFTESKDIKKYLEWDCISNLPYSITHYMPGCVKDTPISQEEIQATTLQEDTILATFVVRALQRAENIKKIMEADYSRHNGEWPSDTNLNEYGGLLMDERNVIENISIRKNGEFIVNFAKNFGRGKFMAFAADISSDGIVDWRCTTNLNQSIVIKSGYECGIE